MKLEPDNRWQTVQNIVLSGGSVMVPGFKLRLKQEIRHMVDSRPEFEELRTVRKFIKIPDSIYAPNCIAWVGASIMMNLSSG